MENTDSIKTPNICSVDTESLVSQVTRMLEREAYHYCADCHTHCRQTILAVEALKETIRERLALLKTLETRAEREVKLLLEVIEDATSVEYERIVKAIRDLRLNFVPTNTVLAAIAPAAKPATATNEMKPTPAFDHAFEPNQQCSGLTCEICGNNKEWHDKRDESLRRRRALMPDYDKRLEDWLS